MARAYYRENCAKFFSIECLVQVKGKNKLVPRLLGVNKESVMRVDERDKNVIKEWPLEQVRRWAASPNTFTLVRCWRRSQ